MQNTERTINKERPPDLRVGDEFETEYPFFLVTNSYQKWDGVLIEEDRWIGGCRTSEETADSGYGTQTFFTADAEGRRILTVLGIAEMPKGWQRRVIYSVTLIQPDGKKRRNSKAYIVTEARFNRMAKGYFADYDINDDEWLAKDGGQ